MSRPSRCSIHQEEFTLGEHPRKLQPGMPGYNIETRHGECSSMVWAAMSWYFVDPIVTPYGQIIAKGVRERD
jgi:hypothetical protein